MPGTLPPLRLADSWDHEEDMIAEVIRAQAVDGGKLEILEAGCGRAWPFDLSGSSFRLTGVDTDPHALEARIEQGDLAEAIHGDLRTVELDDASFDVVYCAFVLEHVEDADRVMDNFARWLKPGGVAIVRIPDGDSVFGFITKHTPHWVHVLYRRFIVGQPNAGKPGFEPYPTHYHPIVGRRGFHEYCEKLGLEVVDEWGFPFRAHSETLPDKVAVAGAKGLAWMSRGRLESAHQNITFVVRRPATG